MLNCLNNAKYKVVCDNVEMSVVAKEKLLKDALASLGVRYDLLVVDAGMLGSKPRVKAKVVDSKKVKGVQVADLLAGCGARGSL